jgi:putative oxidoreductase
VPPVAARGRSGAAGSGPAGLIVRPVGGPAARDAGLLVLRLVLGITFYAHGSQKLFGAFHGAGLDGTRDFFASIGIEPAGTLAAVSAVAEFGGGVLSLLGLLMPVAAAVLLVDMVVAAIAYNAHHGFFITGGGEGFEINLLLGGIALALGLLGAGRLSVDGLLASARRDR